MTDVRRVSRGGAEDVTYRFRAWDDLAVAPSQVRWIRTFQRSTSARRGYWVGGALLAGAILTVAVAALMGLARILDDAENTHVAASPGTAIVWLDPGRFDILAETDLATAPRVSVTGPHGVRTGVTAASSPVDYSVDGSTYQLIGAVVISEAGSYSVIASAPEYSVAASASPTGLAIRPSMDESVRWVLLVFAGGLLIAAGLFAGGVAVLARAILLSSRVSSLLPATAPSTARSRRR